jgi:ABC-type transport system involved in multi-copper enzyme maturation permease subunit
MNHLLPSLNPIIVKEFRSRMRGGRAFIILTAYLVFLALFSYVMYRVTLSYTMYIGPATPLSPMVGRALYAALTNLSLFFVVFLTPALTATAISSEQEKLTLEMLQATPLSTHAILFGKLIATASYILLLLLAAIPLASMVFVFGGIAPLDLLLAGLLIVITAYTFGMIGLFFSVWRKRTIQAISLSYLLILFFIVGAWAIYIFWGILIQDVPPRFILITNPFSALASLIAGSSYQSAGGDFFTVLGGQINQPFSETLWPLWYYTTAFYLALSTTLYLLATRLLKPIRPWRIGWRGALLALALLGLHGVVCAGLTLVEFEDAFSQAVPTPDFSVPPPPAMAEPAVAPERQAPAPDNGEEKD